MDDLDRILVLTEEIGVLRSRFEPNSGMGNINMQLMLWKDELKS